MDDLLSEFLTETAENLDLVDLELIKLERETHDREGIDKVFRLVHTVKGTCGFLGLPRLEAVAHASENLLGKFRDGTVAITPEAVSLVLESIDRIKLILAGLEADEAEPAGDDSDLIARLNAAAALGVAQAAEKAANPRAERQAGKAEPQPKAKTPSHSGHSGSQESAVARTDDRSAQPGADRVEIDGQNPSVPEPTRAARPEQPDDEAASAGAAARPSGSAEANQRVAESAIANQSIRVHVDVIENLMTMVSELVLTRNQLLEMVRRAEDSEFKVPIQRLSNITAELQEGVMKTRMQPIGNAWQKLPRIVRDLARELGKKIDLEMAGAETELDRQVLELIKDPLTHMIRNSADHGLETPAERKAAGKPATGQIRLRAFHEGGHIIIEIADDGRGLNIEKIKAKALANGLVSEADLERMSEAQIQRFIFHPGISTAAKVTNVSGRGVGMDVVRSNIEQIGGAIDLRSAPGQGTAFTIKIPLTLAIVSALIVGSGGQRFAIPQLSVLELVRARANSEHRIERINKTPVLRLRNRLLPLVQLSRLLKICGEEASETDSDSYIIVAQVGALIFGIVVDEVFDTEEIVVKPVASILRHISMFSGNTILGDGSVIMIVDPNGIAASIRDTDVDDQVSRIDEDEHETCADEQTALLIFRAGNAEPKAVPLSLVTRLEEIEVDKIESSNNRPMVQYRGRLMPLIHADINGRIRTEGRQPILVFTDMSHAMGLVVDEIVDVVEEKLTVELAAEDPNVIGSAIVRGKATEVIDVGYYLKQAFADWFDEKRIDKRMQERRVLFVDDSPFFRNMVTPLLQVAGYAVTTVENADAALKLKEDGRTFDVIVSDIEMPGTDGLTFARLVRQDTRWFETPMIALTSLQEPDDVKAAKEAGFTDYLAKFDRDVLITAINEQFERGEEAA